MAKKIQFKINNVKSFDVKKITKHLEDNYDGQIRNIFNQKDKRHNITIFFSAKNDETLLSNITEFFKATSWKCEMIK